MRCIKLIKLYQILKKHTLTVHLANFFKIFFEDMTSKIELIVF